MDDLKIFNKKNIKEYYNYFINTLLETNKTYDYFVDWKKINKNLNNYKTEIFLLNSLRDSKNIKNDLKKLIKKYPNVVKVIPYLFAERVKSNNLKIYDIEQEEIISFNFNKKVYSEKEIEILLTICEKVGVLSLISKTNDLYDYTKGVEVGLDSNGRKNRSGKIFEKIIGNLLYEKLNGTYKIKQQDNTISLFKTKNNKKINRHDFIIIYNDKPFCVIEVNFYNTTGSKPDSIVGNYIHMNEESKKKNILFIWITDGPAWKNMGNYLIKGMEHIEYILNYRIAKKYLKKILDDYIKYMTK